jgi:hypothetical protein
MRVMKLLWSVSGGWRHLAVNSIVLSTEWYELSVSLCLAPATRERQIPQRAVTKTRQERDCAKGMG